MDWKYLTRFELTNEREKRFFRIVGTGINDLRKSITKNITDLGRKVKDVYKKTPISVKAGGLVALSVLGTIGTTTLLKEEPKEETIFIQYRVEHAPYRNPTYRSDIVNMKEFKQIKNNPYNTILDSD